MKRYITLIVCAVISLAAMAKSSSLNVEKLFDGSYNSEKTVSIHISKSKGKYFRGFTVNNNASLVKKVTTLYRKDVEKAEDFHDIIANGGLSYSTMTIKLNGQIVKIGISYSPENSCYLFIDGPTEAFK
ncbi:MAG: hypothetical protein K2K84_05485 [Muribaculaceae bacterium]|nr:hypothetical protein [Muribaculaceae bacterium]